MVKCHYNCNRKATTKLKNGRWCCESNFKLCPEIIRKSSISRTGVKRTKEMRKRMSEAHIGQESTKKGKSYEEIYGKRKAESIKKKIIEAKKLTEEMIKNRYPLFCTIEEIRVNDSSIEVRCNLNTCRKWFKPIYNQLYERIRQIEHKFGSGGSYFYCCEEHKLTCPLYKYNPFLDKDIETIKKEDIPSWLKKKIFERDNYRCIYCDSEENLHLHHILPRKIYPHFEFDIEYIITVCRNCHYKYCHTNECSTGRLAIYSC